MSGAGRAVSTFRSLITPLAASVAAALLAVVMLATTAGATIEEAKLLASDGAEKDFFGFSVAISGDTAVVGATDHNDNGQDSGAAYVYVRSGSTWTEQAKLTASDGAVADLFGFSVSISGETIVVGARDHGNEGAAYVYVRSGTTWAEQAKLTASDAAGGDFFGYSVSVSGNTAVVGAFFDDDNGFQSGSAYVYVRSGSTWTEQAKLTASDGAQQDFFGSSISLHGDTVVVGAFGDDDIVSLSGAAYVFVRSGTTWTQQAKLTADDADEFDQFGESVSVDLDTVVVGALFDADNGDESGSAYVYLRNDETWTQQAKLTPTDGATFDRFGKSVSIIGNIVAVGANFDSDAGPATGSAYLYERSGTIWTQTTKVTAGDGAASDHFGTSIAISGGAVVIGALGDDDNGMTSGSAYVYRLEDSDGDGVPDLNDSCPDDPEDVDGFEDADGCPDPDNDNDNILDGNDACPLLAGIPLHNGCPPPGPPAVGGITGLLESDDPAVASASRSDSFADIAVLASIAAAALIAGGWYARRRWLP